MYSLKKEENPLVLLLMDMDTERILVVSRKISDILKLQIVLDK